MYIYLDISMYLEVKLIVKFFSFQKTKVCMRNFHMVQENLKNEIFEVFEENFKNAKINEWSISKCILLRASNTYTY